jgi:hypothetical protein
MIFVNIDVLKCTAIVHLFGFGPVQEIAFKNGGTFEINVEQKFVKFVLPTMKTIIVRFDMVKF